MRVSDLAHRRVEPTRVEPEGTYQMLGLLNHGRGVFERGQIRGADTKYPRLQVVRAGDLVYSRLFGWEGSVAVSDRDGWVSPEFPVYDIDLHEVTPAFLRHGVSWSGFVEQLSRVTVGMGQRRQRVPPDAFEAATIPLPDLDEQRRIAARLDAVAAVGVAGEHHHRLPSRVRSRVLSQATGGAPLLPFGDLFDLQRRQVKPREGLDYTEIGVRSFGRGLFLKPTVSAEDIGAKRVFEVRPDDLVISNIFAWEGAVALADARHVKTIGSHRFMTWTPKDPSVDVRYAAAYLTSSDGIASLRAASPGSAGRNRTLSITKLQAIEIPVPEQQGQMQLIRALSLLQHAVTEMEHRATLAAALPPAARNEEFSRLVAQAR